MKRLLVILALAVLAKAQAKPLDAVQIETRITQGWCELASAQLDSSLAAENPNPQALFLKAKCDLMLGHLEEAQKWGEKSVKAAPDSAEYWAQLGTIKAFRIRRSPMKGITLGRSSRKDYERALEIDPRNLTALESMMMFRLYAPGIAGGDKDQARRLAEQILAVDSAQGHLARAHILRWADKDMDRARVEMQAAAEASADNPAVCYELGRRLVAEGYNDDGLIYYRLGAGRDPDAAAGQLKLASVCLKLNRLAEAQGSYHAVLSADPENADALTGQALVQAAQGQPEAAAQILRALLESRSDYLPARYHLARIYLALGTDHDQSASLLREYLDGYLNLNWPSRAFGNWQLALALEKLGQYREAWQTLSLAMDLAPGNDDMKQDAQRLEFMGKD